MKKKRKYSRKAREAWERRKLFGQLGTAQKEDEERHRMFLNALAKPEKER